MTPSLSCPNCDANPVLVLQTMSAGASVIYYRCPRCTHVWAVSKDDPTDVRHVTGLNELTKH